MTSPLDRFLSEVRARLEAATPVGQWEHRYENGSHGVFFGQQHTQRIAVGIAGRGNGGQEEAQSNAALIATAPDSLARLLAIVCELRDHVEGLSHGPYKDSNLASYCEMTRTTSIGVLERIGRIAKGGGE